MIYPVAVFRSIKEISEVNYKRRAHRCGTDLEERGILWCCTVQLHNDEGSSENGTAANAWQGK